VTLTGALLGAAVGDRQRTVFTPSLKSVGFAPVAAATPPFTDQW
jgi:hypothetical protein